jgi:hypothetical protein
MAGADFAKRFTKMSTAVASSNVDTVKAAALAAKQEHLKVIRRDAGGDLTLSNVGRRKGKQGGRKVGARFDVDKKGSNRAEAIVIPTGPLPLIASPIVGHVIRSAYLRGALRKSKGQSQTFGPALGKISGATRRTVLRTPWGWRQSVRHPGTKGKRTWTRGRKAARPKITRIIQRQTFDTIKRGM